MKALRAVVLSILTVSCGGNVSGPDAPVPTRYVVVPTYGLGSLSTMGICVAQVTDGGRAMRLLNGSPFGAKEITPSALVVHPNGRVLYATNNVYYAAYGQPDVHEIWSFAIDPERHSLERKGAPLPVPVQVNRLAMTPSGRFIYATSYTPPAITAFAVDAATGDLQAVPGSPFAVPQPDELVVDPQGRFLLVTQFFDEREGVAVYAIDPSTGALAPTRQGFLPAGETGAWVTERLLFGRDGRTVYLGVGEVEEEFDAIKAFDFDPAGGRLTPMDGFAFRASYQSMGRGLALSPSGEYLLAGNGSFDGREIAVLRVLGGGRLAPVPGSPFPAWARKDDFPVSDIVFDASGEFAVVSNFWGALIVVRVDRGTGALSALDTSLLPLPNQPGRLVLLQ